MEQSTIKVSNKTKKALKRHKNYPDETYESIITRLLKDNKQDDMLSEETIRSIEEGIADIRAGRVYTTEQLNKELEL